MPRRKQKKTSKKHHSSSSKSSKSSKQSSKSYGITKSQLSTIYYLLLIIGLIFLFCAFFIYLPKIRQLFGLETQEIDPIKLRGYKTRLRKIYEKYNPNKLDEMEDILLKYRGKEKELFRALHKKYVIPNRKVKEKERKEKKERKRRKRAGIPDDYIPEDETEEEAIERRRKKKERNRKKRKEERKKERGGKDYYDDWDDDESPTKRKKYNQYFDDEDDDDIYFSDDSDAKFEGEIELLDDVEDDDDLE